MVKTTSMNVSDSNLFNKFIKKKYCLGCYAKLPSKEVYISRYEGDFEIRIIKTFKVYESL